MHQGTIGFVLYRFDRGSRQVKRDPVDLVTVDYDNTTTLCLANVNSGYNVWAKTEFCLKVCSMNTIVKIL